MAAAGVARWLAIPTVYVSPLSPELRTRVWLEFLDFPSHLWSQPCANRCLCLFGGVTYFDAAEFRRSGRMLVEANVTRVTEIPKRVTVIECLVPGLAGIVDFTYDVRLVVLSAEPVFDDEEEGGTGMSRLVMQPYNAAAVYGEDKVGTEERPEYVSCFLSWNDRGLWN